MGSRPGQLRIIGGKWRNTRLAIVDADGLRPTPDRARETLFNWLQAELPGARVLDLFAGTGALGIEALSRGAAEALLVERAAMPAEMLERNLKRLEGGERGRVMRADALELLAAPLFGRFDIVFVDPPFDAGLWEPVVEALDPWVREHSWLYIESPPDARIEPGPGWVPHRETGSRQARHALYRRAAGPARSNGGAATLAATEPTDPRQAFPT